MPPRLTTVLAALEIEASPSEYAAVERSLGGSFSRISEIRLNPVEKIDAVDLTGQEIRSWLTGLPIGPQTKLHVAWIADRLGARMSFEDFVANFDDFWYPAMDDIVAVLYLDEKPMFLVLDHEELFTLSILNLTDSV